jgi:predicted phage terminase large subunit-like protein
MMAQVDAERRAAAAQELLARRLAAERVEAYIAYCELGFAPAAHHRLILHELEAVELGEVSRLMICCPPGAAKSTYASMVYPAWYLGKHPERSVIAASHTQELAERFGRRVRNLYGSIEHRNVFAVGLAGDSGAAGRWETQKGGEYFAVGVGGAVSGRRCDVGIVDDPVRGREDADSDRARARIWEWYVNDFLPRLRPNAAQVLITTRWHEDDLAGRILERERDSWRLIELPMEALADDPLGRQPGERLWPEWFTPDMVEQAKLDVRSWNALYQQQPVAETGDYFQLDWFGNTYKDLPKEAVRYGSGDYAVSEGKGDFTELGIFAVDAQSNVYVVDWWKGQTSSDRWIEAQCDLIVKHKPVCWFGESGPIKRAVEPYLNRRMTERHAFVRLEWLPSVAEKTARCRPFQALASMGKLYLPEQAAWKADLIGQLTRFPAGKYDDGVDVCSLIGRGIELMPAPRIRHYEPVREGGPLSISTSRNTGSSDLSWMA